MIREAGLPIPEMNRRPLRMDSAGVTKRRRSSIAPCAEVPGLSIETGRGCRCPSRRASGSALHRRARLEPSGDGRGHDVGVLGASGRRCSSSERAWPRTVVVRAERQACRPRRARRVVVAERRSSTARRRGRLAGDRPAGGAWSVDVRALGTAEGHGRRVLGDDALEQLGGARRAGAGGRVARRTSRGMAGPQPVVGVMRHFGLGCGSAGTGIGGRARRRGSFARRGRSRGGRTTVAAALEPAGARSSPGSGGSGRWAARIREPL